MARTRYTRRKSPFLKGFHQFVGRSKVTKKRVTRKERAAGKIRLDNHPELW